MRNCSCLIAALALSCGSSGRHSADGPTPAVSLESLFPLATADDATLCRELAERTLVWDDPEPKHRRKVVISDVHLGPGRTDERFVGLEDFDFDAVFTRFLKAQANTAPTDLIIAGDFVEFWQIEGALGQPPGASQDGAVDALEVAIAAHKEVFASLAKFLSVGDHRVIFIAGNHDAELIWPKVRLRIARELRARDLDQIVFVDALAYRHGGVHIEHGHRFDGANMTRGLNDAVIMDDAGVCRVQEVWGEMFLAEFFNDLERQYPFVDNLSPSTSAMVWGFHGEPDTMRLAGAAAQFADLLVARKNRSLNKTALRAALLDTLGTPFKSADESRLRDLLWEALPSSDGAMAMVERLLGDEEFAPLRAQLIALLDAAPSPTRMFGAVRQLDFGLLKRLVRGLRRSPFVVAASRIEAADIIVFAHTHTPGGKLVPLSDGRYYVNTGAWVPAQRVDALKARGLSWTQLDATDREQFPAVFPAVYIEYDGDHPRPPKLVHFE